MEVPIITRRPRSLRPLWIGAIALAVIAIVVAGLFVTKNGQANNTKSKKGKKDDGPTAANGAMHCR